MKIKVKFEKYRVILLLLIALVIFSVFFYVFYIPKPITSLDFYGIPIYFRSDLRQAAKVPVYPNEDSVRKELMNSSVQNITFAYKLSNTTEDSYYRIEAFEIAQNLYYGYRVLVKTIPGFDVMNISSYENLSGKIENPVIALVIPTYSNETSVTVTSNHTIFVRAKTLDDFDLATEKLLISALGLKV